MLKAGGETAGERGGTGGECSDGRVGSARLGRAGRKLSAGPGKFQRKTKPDELFKGISLSAPRRNFRSAFKIIIVIVMMMIMILITIIIANDGERNLTHSEGGAGCSPAALPAGVGCSVGVSGWALPAAGRGARAQQQCLQHDQIRFRVRERENKKQPSQNSFSSSPLPHLLWFFFFL